MCAPDEISESGVQAAVRLTRMRLPLCITAGVHGGVGGERMSPGG